MAEKDRSLHKDAMTLNYSGLLTKCNAINIQVTEEEVESVDKATKSNLQKTWFDFRAGHKTASKVKSACHTNCLNPSENLIRAICYPPKTNSPTQQQGMLLEMYILHL